MQDEVLSAFVVKLQKPEHIAQITANMDESVSNKDRRLAVRLNLARRILMFFLAEFGPNCTPPLTTWDAVEKALKDAKIEEVLHCVHLGGMSSYQLHHVCDESIFDADNEELADARHFIHDIAWEMRDLYNLADIPDGERGVGASVCVSG
jgi:hypothetical protein